MLRLYADPEYYLCVRKFFSDSALKVMKDNHSNDFKKRCSFFIQKLNPENISEAIKKSTESKHQNVSQKPRQINRTIFSDDLVSKFLNYYNKKVEQKQAELENELKGISLKETEDINFLEGYKTKGIASKSDDKTQVYGKANLPSTVQASYFPQAYQGFSGSYVPQPYQAPASTYFPNVYRVPQLSPKNFKSSTNPYINQPASLPQKLTTEGSKVNIPLVKSYKQSNSIKSKQVDEANQKLKRKESTLFLTRKLAGSKNVSQFQSLVNDHVSPDKMILHDTNENIERHQEPSLNIDGTPDIAITTPTRTSQLTNVINKKIAPVIEYSGDHAKMINKNRTYSLKKHFNFNKFRLSLPRKHFDNIGNKTRDANMKNVKSFSSAVANGTASHLIQTSHENKLNDSNTKHVKEKISGGSMSLQKEPKFHNLNKSNSDNGQQPSKDTKHFLDLTSEKESQEITEILMDRDFVQKRKRRKEFITQPDSKEINNGQSEMLKNFDSISYYNENPIEQSNFSGEGSKSLGNKYTESDFLSDELESSGETSYSNINHNEIDNEKLSVLNKARPISKKEKERNSEIVEFYQEEENTTKAKNSAATMEKKNTSSRKIEDEFEEMGSGKGGEMPESNTNETNSTKKGVNKHEILSSAFTMRKKSSQNSDVISEDEFDQNVEEIDRENNNDEKKNENLIQNVKAISEELTDEVKNNQSNLENVEPKVTNDTEKSRKEKRNKYLIKNDNAISEESSDDVKNNYSNLENIGLKVANDTVNSNDVKKNEHLIENVKAIELTNEVRNNQSNLENMEPKVTNDTEKSREEKKNKDLIKNDNAISEESSDGIKNNHSILENIGLKVANDTENSNDEKENKNLIKNDKEISEELRNDVKNNQSNLENMKLKVTNDTENSNDKKLNENLIENNKPISEELRDNVKSNFSNLENIGVKIVDESKGTGSHDNGETPDKSLFTNEEQTKLRTVDIKIAETLEKKIASNKPSENEEHNKESDEDVDKKNTTYKENIKSNKNETNINQVKDVDLTSNEESVDENERKLKQVEMNETKKESTSKYSRNAKEIDDDNAYNTKSKLETNAQYTKYNNVTLPIETTAKSQEPNFIHENANNDNEQKLRPTVTTNYFLGTETQTNNEREKEANETNLTFVSDNSYSLFNDESIANELEDKDNTKTNNGNILEDVEGLAGDKIVDSFDSQNFLKHESTFDKKKINPNGKTHIKPQTNVMVDDSSDADKDDDNNDFSDIDANVSKNKVKDNDNTSNTNIAQPVEDNAIFEDDNNNVSSMVSEDNVPLQNTNIKEIESAGTEEVSKVQFEDKELSKTDTGEREAGKVKGNGTNNENLTISSLNQATEYHLKPFSSYSIKVNETRPLNESSTLDVLEPVKSKEKLSSTYQSALTEPDPDILENAKLTALHEKAKPTKDSSASTLIDSSETTLLKQSPISSSKEDRLVENNDDVESELNILDDFHSTKSKGNESYVNAGTLVESVNENETDDNSETDVFGNESSLNSPDTLSSILADDITPEKQQLSLENGVSFQSSKPEPNEPEQNQDSKDNTRISSLLHSSLQHLNVKGVARDLIEKKITLSENSKSGQESSDANRNKPKSIKSKKIKSNMKTKLVDTKAYKKHFIRTSMTSPQQVSNTETSKTEKQLENYDKQIEKANKIESNSVADKEEQKPENIDPTSSVENALLEEDEKLRSSDDVITDEMKQIKHHVVTVKDDAEKRKIVNGLVNYTAGT